MSELITLPNIVWRINDISKADKISSPIFNAIGMRWKLKLIRYPDISCYMEEKRQLIFKRLSPIDDSRAKGLKFCVTTSIVVNGGTSKLQEIVHTDTSFQEWCLWSHDVGMIWGHSTNLTLQPTVTFLISVSLYNLPSHLPNIALDIESQKVKIPPCLASLSEDFKKLLNHENVPSDIVLKCGEICFGAHRTVLSARSEVFAGMFRSDMKESREGVVCIEDMDPSTFEQFLCYLYTGHIPNLHVDTSKNLYIAADKYAVGALKVKCALFATENCTEKDTKKSNHPETAKDSDCQLKKNPLERLLRKLFQTSEWQSLAEEFPDFASDMCRPFLMDRCHIKLPQQSI